MESKETVGKRIEKLRNIKDWSQPKLGREMAKAINREKPFSGEMIRKYELDENEPGIDARKALAAVFGKSESYILFGEERANGDGVMALNYDSVITELAGLWDYVPAPAQKSMLTYMRASKESTQLFIKSTQARMPVGAKKQAKASPQKNKVRRRGGASAD